MDEVWRPIPGFSDYQVSTDGRVWSNDRTVGNRWGTWSRRTGKMIKPFPARDGYPQVRINRDDGEHVSCKVHLLVLTTFVGPCPKGMEALHADDDHMNAKLANLRWGSRSENMRGRDSTDWGSGVSRNEHSARRRREFREYVEQTSPIEFGRVRPSDERLSDEPSDERLSDEPSDERLSDEPSDERLSDEPSDERLSDEPSDERLSDEVHGRPSAARVREAQTRLLELTACTCGGTWYGVYGTHHVDCPAPYREDVVVLVAMAELGRTVTRGYPRQAACATEARVTRNRS